MGRIVEAEHGQITPYRYARCITRDQYHGLLAARLADTFAS